MCVCICVYVDDRHIEAQGHLAFRLLSISFNDAMSLAMIMMVMALPATELTVPHATCRMFTVDGMHGVA